MLNLGTVRPGSTIRIPFNTFDKDDGSSITMTNFAAADILVYKDGSTTERASTSGFTATTDFDSKTGKHVAIIDLADNTTADFWAAGSEYLVAIDAVTVDGVTTGGWVARFCIGYPCAWFDTTIATLTNQTSFTLANGPAEDDALNDMWAIIHDAASAVQCARVLILDYTGSTKTVTLAAGATFTVAAKDNISIMGMAPLQPTVTGSKTVVQTGDSYAIVNSGTHGNANLKTLIDTIDDLIDTEVAAIKAKTDNLPPDPADASDIASLFSSVNTTLTTISGLIDTEVAAIKAKTDNLPSDPADASDIAASFTSLASTLSTIVSYLDTEVAAIKAKTDNLPSDPADASVIAAALTSIETDITNLATSVLQLDVTGEAAFTAFYSANPGDKSIDDLFDAIADIPGGGGGGGGDVLGPGADPCTITIKVGSTPIADAEVWLTNTTSSTDVVAGTLRTNNLGQVTFMLTEDDTYYLWMIKPGVESIRAQTYVAVAD